MRPITRTLLLSALLATGFAAHAQDTTTPAEPATAEATTSALPGGLSAPAEGMGQIVFFRPSKFTGGAISYKVREGETELGKLSNGTFFVIQATPGAHAYTVHSEAKDVLNLEVDAGETYYVSGGMSMGILAGRPNISPSDEATFAGIVAKLKPAKPLKN